jgi:HEAT repeat protein
MRCLFTFGCLVLLLGSAPAADPPPDSVADLVRKLQDEEGFTRLHAAHKLGDMGLAAREAVPALAKALRDPVVEVHVRAAKSLAAIGTPAVPALIEALKHPELKSRAAVAQALAWIGSPAKDAVPALIELLKDRQESCRLSAILALGEIGPDAAAAAPMLVRQLRAADDDKRARGSWSRWNRSVRQVSPRCARRWASRP